MYASLGIPLKVISMAVSIIMVEKKKSLSPKSLRVIQYKAVKKAEKGNEKKIVDLDLNIYYNFYIPCKFCGRAKKILVLVLSGGVGLFVSIFFFQ